MDDNEIRLALRAAVVDGDDVESGRLAEVALKAGIDPLSLVNECIQPAMDQVGQQFQSGKLYLPELILAGDAAAASLIVLKPALTKGGVDGVSKGKVVIGTIQGDLHDIGKNVVSALLTAHGFQVIDLGTDVQPKKFVETAGLENADFIAISSLMTTTLPYYDDVIRLLVDMGKRQNHFVIVGGGPVNGDWAAKIGADGYGRDAHDAVVLCQALLDQGMKPPLARPICFGTLR
jgi:corrinoid protein of di/trimethylamine methyltransferase